MPIYLIRHAHAGSRTRWAGPDADRPLSARGRDEADAVTAALGAAPITRVLSSPSMRCVQTVAGLAAMRGLDIETMPLLAEGAPLEPGLALLDALAGRDVEAAICGHGDLLPEIIDTLRAAGVPLDGQGCAKGSVWVLETRNGRVASGVYHREPATLSVPRR